MTATYDHRTWAATERARHRKDDEIADRGLGANHLSDLSVIGFTPFG